ncbi:hypothetical protein ACOSP7_010591 [Xanthoceras sorbifolium]
MDPLHYLGLLIFFLLVVYKFISQNRIQLKHLPPSPPGLPVLGHFHLLKRPFHLALHNLCKKYGPFLQLGSRSVLVISTPTAIEECFTKNDIIFANRPRFPSRKVTEYNFTGLGTSPYGQHWRNLRRFIALEIFSSRRLQMSSIIRVEEIHFLVNKLFRGSIEGVKKVEVKSLFYMLTFNIMMKMVVGERYFGDELGSDGTGGKYDDIRQTFNPTTQFALGDFYSILRWTFYGVNKKIQKVHRKRDDFAQALINKRRVAKSSSLSDQKGKRTIIDVMLSLQVSEPDYYTNNIIKGIIMAMLIAGTETSASTMESAVLHLMCHPEVFKKAREEIDANVEDSRLLDDVDLAKLPYLHCSSEECTVGGYNIPRGTMLFVNAWALHQDPNNWEDPNMFKPERFLGSEGEKGGYKFIPFGSGRRQCPGAGLAMRLMALSLGILIQCFDWENTKEDIEDAEMNKAEMEIIFRPRKTLVSVLSQL